MYRHDLDDDAACYSDVCSVHDPQESFKGSNSNELEQIAEHVGLEKKINVRKQEGQGKHDLPKHEAAIWLKLSIRYECSIRVTSQVTETFSTHQSASKR